MLHVWCTYSAFPIIILHRMQINNKIASYVIGLSFLFSSLIIIYAYCINCITKIFFFYIYFLICSAILISAILISAIFSNINSNVNLYEFEDTLTVELQLAEDTAALNFIHCDTSVFFNVINSCPVVGELKRSFTVRVSFIIYVLFILINVT